MEPADLLIKGGIVLTMNRRGDLYKEGFVAIKEEQILKVGRWDDTREIPLPAKEVIDAKGDIILPGLINTHTHSPMTLFRGLADDLPLQRWLEEIIFPLEARIINEESVYWGASLAILEMIESGTTTFADGYFFEDRVARAAKDAGIRAVLAPGIMDIPSPHFRDGREAIDIAQGFVEEWKGDSLVTPSLFLHSPYTLEKKTIKEAKDLAERNGIQTFIHLSESLPEVAYIKNRFKKRPVEYLDELGILDPDLVCVHAIWIEEEEIKKLKEKGVKISHCPESAMKLGNGIMPLRKLLDYGIPVGLGTDGPASNNDLDLFLEMDMAAKLHRIASGDPQFPKALAVLKMTTLEAAKVLGLDEIIGSIEEGKRADLIVVGLKSPHLTPLYEPYSALVYCARGSDVKTVIVNGKILMQDREILGMDRDRIIAKGKEWGLNIKDSSLPFQG